MSHVAEEQPNWMTKVFGIALEPILIESEKASKYYNYIRTYKYTDLHAGFKGFGYVCASDLTASECILRSHAEFELVE